MKSIIDALEATGGISPPENMGLRCEVNARVSASQAILDRAYGKAPTFSTTDTTQFKRAIDMTDDELAAIAGRAKLTIVK